MDALLRSTSKATLFILITCVGLTVSLIGTARCQVNVGRYAIGIDAWQNAPNSPAPPIAVPLIILHVVFVPGKLLFGMPTGANTEAEWTNLQGVELPASGGRGQYVSPPWYKVRAKYDVEVRRLSTGRYDITFTETTDHWTTNHRYVLEYDGVSCKISNVQVAHQRSGRDFSLIVKGAGCAPVQAWRK